MTIAFVHQEMILGGSDRVSLAVAERLRERWGVRSYFFVRDLFRDNWIHEAADIENVILLTGEGKFSSEINREIMLREIKARSIDWLIIANWQRDDALISRVKSETSCRTIYYLHNTPFFEGRIPSLRWITYRERGGWKSWVSYLIYPLLRYQAKFKMRQDVAETLGYIRHYDAFITLTEGYREEIIQYLGLESSLADKVFSILNTQKLIAPTPLEEKEKEIVYVGRLEKIQKRVDRLLLAWAKAQPRLEGWKLSIYGKGRDEAYLKALAKKLGLRAVEFKGWTTDSAEVFRRASISCQTSTFEGWPLSLVESQRMGAVPIAMDCCSGVREIIGADKQYGRLVTAGDVPAFADVLVETCQDCALRREITGRMMSAQKRYSPEVNDSVWARILGLGLPQGEERTD